MDVQSVASSEWEDLGLAGMDEALRDFFQSRGLSKFAKAIVEATDVETLEDLKLVDRAMAEDVIQQAGLKLVSAKKLRLALAELRGEPAASPPPAAAEASAPSPLAEARPPEVQEASTAAAQEAALAFVQECVVICIDRSGSMGAPFAEVTLNVVKGAVTQRTRMEAVKAMFYAFRDRTESAGLGSHQMGLLQFDDHVERLLELTPRLDRFEAIVDDMEKRGTTAIFSSILKGAEMLEEPAAKDPRTDLRVLVLTDGQNNTGVPPQEALAAVNRIGAVVDAIIVGDKPDANLRRIVSATGGECYQIRDLGQGFELLEAEGVVSLRARRGGTERPPPQPPREPVDFDSIAEKALTQAGSVHRAPALDQALAKTAVADVSKVADNAPAGGAAQKRVLSEMKKVASGDSWVWMHTGEGIHVFPAPDNILFWRVLIEGPSGSPFEGGVFALNVVMPGNYPFGAPSITFETPVYHCNVNDSGKICLDILKEKWSPALSVPKCLEAIRLMLSNPDTDNSLRQWIAELTLAHVSSNGSDTRYFDKAREATLKDASMTVEEWKQKWGC